MAGRGISARFPGMGGIQRRVDGCRRAEDRCGGAVRVVRIAAWTTYPPMCIVRFGNPSAPGPAIEAAAVLRIRRAHGLRELEERGAIENLGRMKGWRLKSRRNPMKRQRKPDAPHAHRLPDRAGPGENRPMAPTPGASRRLRSGEGR